MKKLLITFALLFTFIQIFAEDGYRLWLRYDKISDPAVLTNYRRLISSIVIEGNSSTILAAKKELTDGLQELLDKKISVTTSIPDYSIVAGSITNQSIQDLVNPEELHSLGDDGFLIKSLQHADKHIILITANKDIAVLYGTFHFLRLLQTHQSIQDLDISSAPKIQLRILDHWDNLNRTVERGYAGISIWNWQTLPGYLDKRYTDYARANASIGINGSVLNNVNANAVMLTKDYLIKAAALASIFRPYGIKVYLSARFSAPMEIGG